MRPFHLNPLKKKPVRSKVAKKIKDFSSFIEPQLALLVDSPPSGEGWIHETKFDGYRIQAHLRKEGIQLYTRTAQDWTAKFPTVARALQKAKIDEAIFDGEIVWVDEKGRSDFQKLQNALKEKESTSILYYVFDLLSLNGKDLRLLPLKKRKSLLEKALAPLKGTAVLYSDHHLGEAEGFLEVSCDYQLEGIVSKKLDSNWLKSKCKQRQEFVIGGFTKGEETSQGFGALLLGVYDKQKLRYVGKVRAGFTIESLFSLRKQLSALEQRQCPFQGFIPQEKAVHWVEPKLVAEVRFSNWTADGFLRVPVFQGLREDKLALQVFREKSVDLADRGNSI